MSKKWYLYRNEKGMEIKEYVRTPLTDSTPKHEGYKLIRTIDLSSLTKCKSG